MAKIQIKKGIKADLDLGGTTDLDLAELGYCTDTKEIYVGNGVSTTPVGSEILDEDNMVSDSNTKLATQQSIKAYVDGAATPSGLQTIDEGSGDGLAIIGRTSANYGTLGSGAVDLSRSNNTSSVFGATGTYSYAEGFETEASGQYSHAEGIYTVANNSYGHAEGVYTIAKNTGSHAAGLYNIGTSTETIHETGIGINDTTRKNAFEIYDNGTLTAPESTIALIDSRGIKTLITKEYYSAGNVGSATKLETARTIDITGDITATAVAFDGSANIAISAAVNNDSHTHSTYALLNGNFGVNFNANRFYADTTIDCQSTIYAGADNYAGRSLNWGYNNTNSSIIAHYDSGLGSYTKFYSNNTTDNVWCLLIRAASNNKIALSSNGNGYFDGVADAGGADYAEYYEWADGNINEEDRIGVSVIFVEGTDTIRPSLPEDDPSKIIGIVSAMPAIVGNTASLSWGGMTKKDDFGRRVKRVIKLYTFEYEVIAQDESGDTKMHTGTFREDDDPPEGVNEFPLDAVVTEKEEWDINTDYDPNLDYTPREKRVEWDAIGLVGKLRMVKGLPTGDRWIKIRNITDEIEEWLVR